MPPDIGDEFKIETNKETSHLLSSDITRGDMKLYGDIISFGLQCLFIVEKWETIVNTVTRFNKIISLFPKFSDESNSYLRIYVLEFSLYAQERLYQATYLQTKNKRDELKLRVQQFNIGKPNQFITYYRNIEKENNWKHQSKISQGEIDFK